MSSQAVIGPGEGRFKGNRDKMKVAVVTDDLKSISPHFGMATHYLVYLVEAGEIIGKEVRQKVGHGSAMHEHGRGGPVTPEEMSFHDQMLRCVADCTVLIAGGMGRPMYSSIKGAGMKAFITDVRDADEAVRALLSGRLENRLELLH